MRAQTRPAGPTVDPRARGARVAAGRAAGRRRLRILVVLLALIVVLGVAGLVSVSPLLDVDHLQIAGLHHLDAAQIESAAGVHHGDAMVWLDTGRAVRGIEALPYVEHAEVRRAWPATVRIVVRERTPVAWIDGAGAKSLVDGTGHVIDTVGSPPRGMPQLLGVRSVPAPGGVVAPLAGARVAAGLAGLVAAGTTSVETTDHGVVMHLAAGPEIRLGVPTLVAVKVRAALAVLGATQGTEVHYIDVSVPTNPVAG
jgi:cell division protein FtsQ